MKRALSTGHPAAPTDLPLDTNLIEDSFPDPPVEQTQSEPALFNRTAANPSMEMGDEVNRPSTPVDTHSAPEKSDRSSSASSAAVSNTAEDSLRKIKQAADQGHANAQYNLGVMYYKGVGVGIDKAKAFEWCQKAAEQGNANAQFNLGVNGMQTLRMDGERWLKEGITSEAELLRVTKD